MYRFWNHVIEPIFEATKPRIIVEIGAGQGNMTSFIAEYCTAHQANAHIIDPVASESLQSICQQHTSTITYYEEKSLDALEKVGTADIVLIDGDHNWYTVLNELQLIEKHMQPFPVVLFHDVGWPYGRRDMYHDISTIPPTHLQANRLGGIDVRVRNLTKEGGINREFHHSIYENNIRNGVKTAIEDFVKQTTLPLKYAELPGLHGFGMLYRPEMHSQLEPIIQAFDMSDLIKQHIEMLDQERLLEQQGKCWAMSEKMRVGTGPVAEEHAKQRKRIDALEEKLKAMRHEHNMLKDSYRSQQTLLEKKRAELHKTTQREKVLKRKVLIVQERMSANEKHLHNLMRTRSWVWTAPLRKLMSMVPKKRR